MRVLIYSARSAAEEIERLADLTDGAEIDAVVITGTFYGDPRTGWLIERGVPFVSFGRPWGGEDVYRSVSHVGGCRRRGRDARGDTPCPRELGTARRLRRLAVRRGDGRRP